jgi:hypothetical protein
MKRLAAGTSSVWRWLFLAAASPFSHALSTLAQGLTLVHFSAQLERFV